MYYGSGTIGVGDGAAGGRGRHVPPPPPKKKNREKYFSCNYYV